VAQEALSAQLWGEARRLLQLAGATETGVGGAADGRPAPSARICRLMAALAEAEHGDGTAARAWLARAAEAPPDPLWLCAACAAESRDWQPLCPQCRAFDSLAWQIPKRARPLIGAYPPEPGPLARLPAGGAETGRRSAASGGAAVDARRRRGLVSRASPAPT